MEESPIIEETTEEVVTTEPDTLLDELKAAGVTNSEELQNKLQASSQVGNMAHKLGEERKANAELIKRLESIETKVSNPVSEDYSTEYGQPIDLQGEVRKALKAEKESDRMAAEQAHKNQMAAWNTIQNDPDFNLVKPVWDEKLKDPNFVFSIQSGQTNPIAEFQNLKTDYYKGIIRRSAETIEKLQGGKVETPVTETGHANAEVAVTEQDDDQKEILEALNQKLEKGGQLTEAEELAALQASFLK